MKKSITFLILIITIFNLIMNFYSVQATEIEEIQDINNLETYSPCIAMLEEDTGDILYDKKAFEKMYPASTTKIMTAILTIENCNLYDATTVSYNAIASVPSSYTRANLQVGEVLTIEDLLYATLIPSANDAANVLAEHIGGSIESFATMMNTKASEIGCKNTNFTNPSGVHNENHYTTAYDLALIARYAMGLEEFRKVVSTTSYVLPDTDWYNADLSIYNGIRKFNNSNALIKPEFKNDYYEFATGIKTGYTNASKDCVVASAKKDNVEFIIVVLGAGNLENGRRQKYVDCKNLFNFAFDNYTSKYLALQEEKKNSKTFENVLENQKLSDNEKSNIISKILVVIILLSVLKILQSKVSSRLVTRKTKTIKRKKRKKNYHDYGKVNYFKNY